MSISQNFPSTRPSLNLNFARSQKLDPRITFTRSSSATYTGGDGLIKSAATNTPRFDFDATTGDCLGLLIEEARTNLVLRSEEFDNASWAKVNSTVTANSITAPNGALTADTLVEDTATSTHVAQQGSFNVTSGTTYTLSCYAKPAGRNFIQLLLVGGFVTTVFAIVDITNGTVGTTAGSPTVTAVNAGNGWYRISITATATATTTTFVQLRPAASSGTGFYQGDGTSGIYVWGAQLEEGAFPTSYIPTVASTVTRSADNASITGANFSSFYNPSEGTLFAAARINALGGSNYPGIAYVDDGTIDNCIGFYINDPVNDIIGAEAYISNVAQYNLGSSSAIVPNQLNKAITAYKVNDFAAAFSMSETVGTDASGSIPTVNRLIIGLLRGGNAPLNGTISQLTYYPVRLSNSQLQSLTK